MIKIIILDVDGTLTDSKLYIGNQGEELKAFNVKDGLGIVAAIKSGIKVILITGKTSKIVEQRATELGISEIHQGISDKTSIIKNLCSKYNVLSSEIAYMGDDLNDYSALSFCGFSGCPADAASDILDLVDFVSDKNGGEGAVREFIELILRKQDLWSNILNNYVKNGGKNV